MFDQNHLSNEEKRDRTCDEMECLVEGCARRKNVGKRVWGRPRA